MNKEEQLQVKNAFRQENILYKINLKKSKHKAEENASSDLVDYKSYDYKVKKQEINQAWKEHDDAAKKTKAKEDKLTAKQIKDFLESQRT